MLRKAPFSSKYIRSLTSIGSCYDPCKSFISFYLLYISSKAWRCSPTPPTSHTGQAMATSECVLQTVERLEINHKSRVQRFATIWAHFMPEYSSLVYLNINVSQHYDVANNTFIMTRNSEYIAVQQSRRFSCNYFIFLLLIDHVIKRFFPSKL